MFRSRKPGETGDPDAISEDMLVIVDRAVNPYLVMFHDPASYRAEQFRGLRNQLVAMNPDGAAKTLVVTSAIKSEGKTVTAINLAIALAELERNSVLLVDGDLRAPSVESYLNLNQHAGFGDVLLDRVAVKKAVRNPGIRNLWVMGAGTRLAGPSEILTTTRVDEVFSRLKEEFQYVVIDTPPVLSATDASVMAARADGTLLTVRLEHSPKNMTRDALRNLQDLGANVLGVFVTEVRGTNPDTDPRLSYQRQEEL